MKKTLGTIDEQAAAFALAYSQWYRPNFYRNIVQTKVGEIAKIDLPDGSTLSVNTNTRLSVQFSRTDRTIGLLHGEAHFDVAKDADRPFTVSADKIKVQAVGTAFSIRNEAGSVSVLVTDGKVKVDDTVAADRPETQRLLVAGKRASIARAAARQARRRNP